MNRYFKRSCLLGAVILLLLILFTIISLKNYAGSLNRVTVSSTAPNQLRIQLTTNGILRFAKMEQIPLPAGCRIEEVYQSAGEKVAAGEPLVRLNETDLSIAYYELLLEKETLASSLTGEKNLAQSLTDQLLIRLQEEEDWLVTLLQAEGIVMAPLPGQLIAQTPQPGSVTAQGASLTIGDPSGDGYLEWWVPADDYRPFSQLEAMGNGSAHPLRTASCFYQEQSGRYQFRSEPIPLSELSNPADGMIVPIRLRYVSQEYPAVLPITSLHREADGAVYVYLVRQRDGLLGTEDYLQRVGVTIQEQDQQNAAILSPLEGIVVTSNRSPKELEPVLVIE